MVILICKNCYEKKYGKLPFMFKKSKKVDICYICSKKKRMIDDGRPEAGKGILIVT